LKACSKIPDLQEILFLGFYSLSTEWNNFIEQSQKEFNFKIRYLYECERLGTGGGLNKFREEILRGSPKHIFVLHCDVCCSFPLLEMLQFHKIHGKECTILGTKVPVDETQKYGCLAIEPITNEALHYAEKPETFVSDIINCGAYLFSPAIFDLIDQLPKKQDPFKINDDPHFLRLEQDLLMNICGEKHVYVYQTKDFWLQIKSSGMVIKCSENLLSLLRKTNELSKHSASGPIIVGDVLIHPTAQIHPTAKLGPNVSVGANVVIGAGVRVLHSILLDFVQIKEHACISYSIVGWNSSIGQWSRLEGVPDYSGSAAETRGCGMTILGSDVKIAPEVIIRSCVVLPHKDLSGNYYNQILL